MTARIEHTALWTNDIELLAAFYSDYFDARIGERYTNPAKGFESRFLSFAAGARIELMRCTRLSLPPNEEGKERLGLAHLAFSLGAEAKVDALTARLRQDDYTVLDGPRRTGDGYYESTVADPDGNRIEITV